LFGPSSNVLLVPGSLPGLSGLLPHLRSPATRSEALLQAGVILCGVGVMAGAVVLSVRRRDWAWLIALFVLMLLPWARTYTYSYVKFYTMLPVLLATSTLAVRPVVALCLGSIMLLFNGGVIAASVERGRTAYAVNAEYEETLPAGACWLTAGWSAHETEKWTGFTCGLLRSFFAPKTSGTDLATLSRDVRRDFRECVTKCFCESAMVMTDEFTPESRDTVHRNGFYYPSAELDELLWTPDKGVAVPKQPSNLFVYSNGAQAQLCSRIRDGSPTSAAQGETR
jgi:hypothetical protein